MHSIARKALRSFWEKYPDAEQPLRHWERRVKNAVWTNFADLKRDFGTADKVGPFVVFNIGGNKFRLVADVDYKRRIVFVRHVLTHRDYDRGKWKRL
jgi:mRNA interferase HigB